MVYNIAFLIGAGASQPFDLPITEELAQQFLKKTKNQYLPILFDKKTNFDIEDVLRAVHEIKDLSSNEGIRLLSEEGVDVGAIYEHSRKFAETTKELDAFIRSKCLKPDIQQAEEIYKQIFTLRKISIVNFFTTNYDVILEDVCNKLGIPFSDGFVTPEFGDEKIFDLRFLNRENVRICKLHGSINWWSGGSQNIFKIRADFSGSEEFSNLMLNAEKKEKLGNYPFDILHRFFRLELEKVDEIIAIGHRFKDSEITTAIKTNVQNYDLHLTIVNPEASQLKKEFFDDHNNVVAYDKKFEEWVKDELKNLKKKIEKQNKISKDKGEKIRRGQRKRLVSATQTIRDLEEERDKYKRERDEYRDVTIKPSTRLSTINNIDLAGIYPATNIAHTNVGNNIVSNTNRKCRNCEYELQPYESIFENRCPRCRSNLN